MVKKVPRFHGLKRPKIRQDMKRENLYNLSRQRAQIPRGATFFKQKWVAKSVTRAYHGEHIREKQWNRLFTKRAAAVVPMDPKYLAEHDGSDQSAGRGMGRQIAPGSKEARTPKKTPYMQMTYHPMERRLDTAVFRALFASSAVQARQFVIHGGVRVNGKLMRYPGYMLNPGDMFQVDPDRVLFALGAKRDKWNAKLARKQLSDYRHLRKQLASPSNLSVDPTADEDADADLAEASAQLSNEEEEEADPIPTDQPDTLAPTRATLKSLRTRTRSILDNPKTKHNLSGKQKQALRALAKNIKTSQSRAASITPTVLEDLELQLTQLVNSLSASGARPTHSEEAVAADRKPGEPASLASEENSEVLEELKRIEENPPDLRKHYKTPWQPRDWLSAFAFIPRYLEVNQNVCSAVYLRHPVCGPGFAEVPTPFNPGTGLLAFSWYLRRR